MDQANGSRSDRYGPQPPPYNPYDDGRISYTGKTYQVGKGGITVVTPPGSYDNMVYLEGQAAAVGPAPPNYSPGLEDSVFADGAIRRGFIRKVYLTLMIQLLVTVGIISAFLYWDALKEWTRTNSWFTYAMMPTVMVLLVLLSCCDNIRRRVPLNFITLGVFTIAEGLMLGSLAVFYSAEAVLWAVGATALVSFSLSVFAMQSKWDFTMASGSLWVFAWTLLSFALLCAILRSQFAYIAYACLGTLLFSLYLVFDTQRIVGGKHRKYEVSPEEYVYAALSLYLDIVTLFLLLLQLINLCR
ncbi:protein lifeguard 1 isoform X1 [Entelurus aequoreus]|uniref:protein lifeguard 1 isoform X1 n=1 Tax=Entelurus aequoreus TaxID=161455 RepID=UPI002B1DC764|nr:protein lifeguard 1 isoform X1 [Entelurus aequoreus]XP_061920281.1 protein lifeguard 1 isoform X1 [Entelurus aequoreus]